MYWIHSSFPEDSRQSQSTPGFSHLSNTVITPGTAVIITVQRLSLYYAVVTCEIKLF